MKQNSLKNILIILGAIIIIIAISIPLELSWRIILGVGGVATTLTYTRNFIVKISDWFMTIDDLKPKYSTNEVKDKIKILWVEDKIKEPLYKEIAEYLKTNKYNIETKKDIKSIDAVKDYQIILCDVEGVGSNIAPNNKGNGIDLIIAINKKFPLKFVVCLSGYLPDNILEFMSNSIKTFRKEDLCISNLETSLDGWIKDYLDPKYFWNKISSPVFVNNKLTNQMVNSIEKAYIADWKSPNLNRGNLEKSKLYKLKNEGEFKKHSEVIDVIVEYIIF